jgi:hypothetical protein
LGVTPHSGGPIDPRELREAANQDWFTLCDACRHHLNERGDERLCRPAIRIQILGDSHGEFSSIHASSVEVRGTPERMSGKRRYDVTCDTTQGDGRTDSAFVNVLDRPERRDQLEPLACGEPRWRLGSAATASWVATAWIGSLFLYSTVLIVDLDGHGAGVRLGGTGGASNGFLLVRHARRDDNVVGPEQP